MYSYLILALIISGIIAVSTLPHILHTQICEYLLYRYVAFIKEKGFVKAIITPRFTFPAKSPRNLLIFAFIFLVLWGYLFYSIYVINDLPIIFAMVLLAFPLSKLLVILGSLVTSPLAMLYRSRYMYVAKRQLANSKVDIIGVTGSYGKSSVKEYLHRILSYRYISGKCRGNHNTDVGIAIEMAHQVTPATQYFIAEMGAYRRGDISKLCKLYPPSIGVVTGVGNQHLSLFGNRMKLIKTKLEMVTGSIGDVYVNLDWDGSQESLKELSSENIITYGLNKDADIRVTELKTVGSQIRFTLKYEGKEESYNTQLLGNHNVINLIPAIAISRKIGMTYEDVKMVVESIEPILGKLSVHTSGTGLKVVNDSYNSNVEGFCSAIDVVSQIEGEDKFVSSLGVYELGKEKASSYERIIDILNDRKVVLLTTDPLFKAKDSDYVKLFESETEILNFIVNLDKSSVVLIEGRHSHLFTSTLGITKAY
ncbi:UDP-N-acetylmuramoyl-tripeptide--D-alanyl-D-alanine ligase [Candidatus Dojkabacteria bacterium]|nr:UDP-N-acetylmuramoyl-tripeptide--D-alanyl-D-alanine ligase [Candidatus Dojkabacteria bacterium]